ncbi:hypothetical protein [Paremcibacter congregatus]|uniref:hypothetical protein n=1 Tax=Paremcibacter congregatus TaxID=2043170 RepID=UPI0030EB76CC
MHFRVLYLLALLLFISTGPVSAGENVWTEKKLGQIILKADRAAQHNKWSRAIRYGEQMLTASRILDTENNYRYISLLKNLNRYYDKAGRITEAADRIKTGYMLSKRHLGLSHPTSLTSRNLYYKLLISLENYADAIPLIQENITVSQAEPPDPFRVLFYTEQLALLYSLTHRYEEEEATLIRLLDLNKKILGDKTSEDHKIILSLAQNYCRQKKLNDFKELITTHQLKFYCKW